MPGEIDEWDPEFWDEDIYSRRVLNASNRLRGVVPDLHVEELERRNPDFSHWVNPGWPVTRTSKEPNIKRHDIHDYPVSRAEDIHPWHLQKLDTGGKRVRNWTPVEPIARMIPERIEHSTFKETTRVRPQVRNWSDLNQPDDRLKDLNVRGIFDEATRVNVPVRKWPMQDMPTRQNERYPIPYIIPGVGKTGRALADWELGKLANDLAPMYAPTMDEWGSDDEEYKAHPPVPHVNFTKSPKLHRRAGCWE